MSPTPTDVPGLVCARRRRANDALAVLRLHPWQGEHADKAVALAARLLRLPLRVAR